MTDTTRADDLVEQGLDAASAYDHDMHVLRRDLVWTRVGAGLAIVALAALMFFLNAHGQQTDRNATTAKKRADTSAQKITTVAGDASQAKKDSSLAIRVLKGAPGARGELGHVGPAGLAGARGRDGARGAQGPPGKVPFTLAEIIADLSPKLTAVIDDRLPAALELACGGPCNGKPGADGKDGKEGAPSTVPGPPGPAGVQGDTGPAGPAGPVGPAGADGAPGPQGIQGDVGPQGIQGPAGTPGTLVLSVQTACPDGNGGFVTGVATDPDGDGNFTCP